MGGEVGQCCILHDLICGTKLYGARLGVSLWLVHGTVDGEGSWIAGMYETSRPKLG